jgi:hypothetical protein
MESSHSIQESCHFKKLESSKRTKTQVRLLVTDGCLLFRPIRQQHSMFNSELEEQSMETKLKCTAGDVRTTVLEYRWQYVQLAQYCQEVSHEGWSRQIT